jgi:hypothetical protein
VSLVDDQGELLTGQLTDFVRDDRELLEGRNDDRFPGFERGFELARSRVNILDDAEGLLELPHGALELTIEDAPVGYDDDRVEDTAVVDVVQRGQLVSEPAIVKLLPLPAECWMR